MRKDSILQQYYLNKLPKQKLPIQKYDVGGVNSYTTTNTTKPPTLESFFLGTSGPLSQYNNLSGFNYDDYYNKAQSYLSRPIFKGTKLTAGDIANAAKDLYGKTKFLMPLDFILTQGQLETGLGTKLKSAHNYFNVGNTDSGKVKNFSNPYESVSNYMNLIYNDYLQGGKKKVEDLLQPGKFVNQIGKRYASAKDYENKIKSQVGYVNRFINKEEGGELQRFDGGGDSLTDDCPKDYVKYNGRCITIREAQEIQNIKKFAENIDKNPNYARSNKSNTVNKPPVGKPLTPEQRVQNAINQGNISRAMTGKDLFYYNQFNKYGKTPEDIAKDQEEAGKYGWMALAPLAAAGAFAIPEVAGALGLSSAGAALEAPLLGAAGAEYGLGALTAGNLLNAGFAHQGAKQLPNIYQDWKNVNSWGSTGNALTNTALAGIDMFPFLHGATKGAFTLSKLYNKPINTSNLKLFDTEAQLEKLRTDYHTNRRILTLDEHQLLNKHGYGSRENYLTNASSSSVPRGISNARPLTPSTTIFGMTPEQARAAWARIKNEPPLNLGYIDPEKTFVTKKTFNRSGLTKEDILSKASEKDKDLIAKMSDEEFKETVMTPKGEIVPYNPDQEVSQISWDPNNRKMILKDHILMSDQEYADMFNQNIHALNDIISRNNKSGIEYFAKELTPSGDLIFHTPEQTIPRNLTERQKSRIELFNKDPEDFVISHAGLKEQPGGTWKFPDYDAHFNSKDEAIDFTRNYIKEELLDPVTISGLSNWNVGINPGQWRGNVENIANTQYLRSIPGLEMRNTMNSVFADKIARRGSGAYESINEYLKRMDLGRVKAGFNSQTDLSKGAWENFINSGRGYGFYANPRTVYGVMKKIGGAIKKFDFGGPNEPYHPITNPTGYKTSISDALAIAKRNEERDAAAQRGPQIGKYNPIYDAQRKIAAEEYNRKKAQENSELAQTMGLFTPHGNNTSAGAIGAETFVNMNPITAPITSSGRLTQLAIGQNPYGFNSNGIISNILPTISALGDVAGVGSFRMLPGSKAVTSIPGSILKKTNKVLGTESGLLSNAYKINPWAFKPKPTSAYRMIGDKVGLQDVIESGYLRPSVKGSDIGKVHSETHYQIGAPSDKRKYYGEYWDRGYPGPYMAEVPNASTDPRFSNMYLEGKDYESLFKDFGKNFGRQDIGDNVWTDLQNYIPTSEAKIYKQDWLRGYKPIEIPRKDIITSSITRGPIKPPFSGTKINVGRMGPNVVGQEIDPNMAPFISYIEPEYSEAEKIWRGWFKDNQPAYKGVQSKSIDPQMSERLKLRNEQLKKRWFDKKEDLVDLYRIQEKGFDINSNTIAQMEKAAAEGRLSPVQKMMLDNPYDRQRLMARDKFWGQWFEKDPKRLEFYIKDKGPESEILHARLPRSEAPQYSIKNFEKDVPTEGKPLEYHQRMSLSPETEFILPKSIIEGAKKYPLSEWERLIKEHKPWMGLLPVAGAAALQKQKQGGVIKDDRGQWSHPGEITEIQGNTMATHGYGDIPLYVIPDVGKPKVVEANTGIHKFPGATKFTEYPMMQTGGIKCPTNVCGPGKMDRASRFIGRTPKIRTPREKINYVAHQVEDGDNMFLTYDFRPGAPIAPTMNNYDGIVFNSPFGGKSTSLETGNVENLTQGYAAYGGPLVEYYKGKMTGPNIFANGGAVSLNAIIRQNRKDRDNNSYSGKISKYQNGAEVKSLNPYEGYSVVDFLKAQGAPSTKKSRMELAKKLGMENYRYTGPQNLEIIKRIKENPSLLSGYGVPNVSEQPAMEERTLAPRDRQVFTRNVYGQPTPPSMGMLPLTNRVVPEYPELTSDISDQITTPLNQRQITSFERRGEPAMGQLPMIKLPSMERPTIPDIAQVEPPEEKLTPAAENLGYLHPLESWKITSAFGKRVAPKRGASKFHNAIDLAAPIGTPVMSPFEGVVKKIYTDKHGGNQLIIQHSDGTTSGYAHLSKYNKLKVGDPVTRGQLIAYTGNSGISTGPHLHFTWRDKNGNLIDPNSIFKNEMGGQANKFYYNKGYGAPHFKWGGPNRMNEFGYLVDKKAGGGEWHHGYYDQYGGDISIPQLPDLQGPLLQYYYSKGGKR